MEGETGFLGAGNWLINHESAIVKHMKRQSSDHSLHVLDTNLEKAKRNFFFTLIRDALGNQVLKK